LTQIIGGKIIFSEKKVSLILPTYKESKSIKACIEGFKGLGVIDEIIVINNNAEPGTSEAIIGTGAREVFETEQQGYGAAISRGISEASGDLVIICEPDGTFAPSDVHKLLAYSPDNNFVVGSRTISQYIWDGANMGIFIKWGNWAVAKIVEVLFNTSYLSDAGCTFRLMDRKAVEMLKQKKLTNDGWYGLAQILEVITAKDFRYTQIPINYLPRVGVSAYTGSPVKTLKIGTMMILLILKYRFMPKKKDR
jgi:glycosyltransferase involved in cell wall biosynthesis